MQPLVVTRTLASVLALSILVVLALLAHLTISRKSPTPAADPIAFRRRGVKGLVIGSDGRASTSKVQPVLWTSAVFYALVFLLLWGRSFGCDAESQNPLCVEAARARDAFTRTLETGLQPEYYVLLGFPLGAAVAAKAMTTAKIADNTIGKPDIREGQRGLVQGLTEVVSNDVGETDLLDFQYFAFNLLTIAFSSSSSSGIPQPACRACHLCS